MSGVPSLAVLVALPLLGLLLLGLQVAARSGARARAVGTVTLGLTAAAALTILGVFYARGGSTLADGLVPGLAIDRTSVTLPALTSVVGLAVLRLAPRRELDRAAVGSLLWITATTQVVFVSAPLELAAAAAASSTIPVGALMTGAARPSVLAPNRVLMAYGGAPWLAVLAVGAVAGGGSFGPLFGALPPAVGGDERALFVGLVIVAAASRSAIFPAHRWFVGLVREGRAARAILLLAPLPGAYLLLRVATLYPEAFVSHLPWLSLLGLVSAAYFGLVALGQGDQRETVVYLVCSQVGLVFLGLAAVDVLSVDGALLLWLAQGVAGSGLLLCALAVRARRGPVSLDRFHGLVAVAPRLAALYFLFGLGVVGLPGTLTFVAEELIAEGILLEHPWLGAGYVLVTGIDAVVFMRLFGRVFLGEHDAAERCPDLSRGERAAALALALVVIAGGIWPNPLIAAHGTVAGELVRAERAVAERARQPMDR
ncbi:MAG: proton-conducting transporter membrane subunit [Sandaracinaceae bacterium]